MKDTMIHVEYEEVIFHHTLVDGLASASICLMATDSDGNIYEVREIVKLKVSKRKRKSTGACQPTAEAGK